MHYEGAAARGKFGHDLLPDKHYPIVVRGALYRPPVPRKYADCDRCPYGQVCRENVTRGLPLRCERLLVGEVVRDG